MFVRNNTPNIEISHLGARRVAALRNFPIHKYKNTEDGLNALRNDLGKLGINVDQLIANRNQLMAANDSIQGLTTTASIATPIQFLQNWLTGFVEIVTAARKIDKLTGVTTAGSWEDEEIVQGVVEMTGPALPYGDVTNVPFANWNANFIYRTVVRFELGFQVTRLEEARAARIRLNSAQTKRESCGRALEIQRNAVGFVGYNSGNNLTYGFLNDPALPSYVTVPNGASGSPHWSTKTFLEITKDIRTMFSTLRTQTLDVIDPYEVNTTLALATAVVDYLTTTSDFGISVLDWLKENYPRCRIESAPELDSANGGANVGYLYAEVINDISTDDGRSIIQVVPAKFQVLGVQPMAKGFIEDYTNATAGVMVKRPFAFTRVTGI